MFLLDTSAISPLVNRRHPKHAQMNAFHLSESKKGHSLFVSVVSIAEMQFGLDVYARHISRPAPQSLNIVRQYIQVASTISTPLPITQRVAIKQGNLRALWALSIAPTKATQGKLKGTHPEQWSEQWPANRLRITENDLWIAAIALTHDLVLVTCDKDFERLAQVEPQIRVVRL